MKLIREARMGAPKSFKTGATVGTYPKPMLYLGFDRGGIDVIPTTPTPGLVTMNVTYPEITFIKPGELGQWVAKPDQPKVLAVQFYDGVPMNLSLDFAPTKASQPFSSFVSDYNSLTGKPSLPWKTIVLDSVTGFTDLVMNHISSFNPAAMSDARQWASMAGGKVRQAVLSMTSLPCHIVVILHSFVEKDELTGKVDEKPNVYSKILREDFFGMFSQVFYACKDMNGQPKILTSDRYPVTGIGPRWPQGLAKENAPDFLSIYGKELAQ